MPAVQNPNGSRRQQTLRRDPRADADDDRIADQRLRREDDPDESNPFTEEGGEVIPLVPDKPGWAHGWKRVSAGNEMDSRNIFRAMNSKMQWEVCNPDDYPEMLALRTERPTQFGRATFEGCIRYHDLVLCRAPARRMRQWQEAHDLRTQQKTVEGTRMARAAFSDPRARFRDEEYVEQYGRGTVRMPKSEPDAEE